MNTGRIKGRSLQRKMTALLLAVILCIPQTAVGVFADSVNTYAFGDTSGDASGDAGSYERIVTRFAYEGYDFDFYGGNMSDGVYMYGCYLVQTFPNMFTKISTKQEDYVIELSSPSYWIGNFVVKTDFLTDASITFDVVRNDTIVENYKAYIMSPNALEYQDVTPVHSVRIDNEVIEVEANGRNPMSHLADEDYSVYGNALVPGGFIDDFVAYDDFSDVSNLHNVEFQLNPGYTFIKAEKSAHGYLENLADYLNVYVRDDSVGTVFVHRINLIHRVEQYLANISVTSPDTLVEFRPYYNSREGDLWVEYVTGKSDEDLLSGLVFSYDVVQGNVVDEYWESLGNYGAYIIDLDVNGETVTYRFNIRMDDDIHQYTEEELYDASFIDDITWNLPIESKSISGSVKYQTYRWNINVSAEYFWSLADSADPVVRMNLVRGQDVSINNDEFTFTPCSALFSTYSSMYRSYRIQFGCFSNISS